jgi:biotin carboxylase
MSIEIASRLAEPGISQPNIALHERPMAPKYRAYAAVSDRPVRLLIVCSRYSLPYRVLQCAAAAGASVYAMGNPDSRSLRLSRYTAGYIETTCPIDGKGAPLLAQVINQAVADHDIDMVMAAGHLATRSLVMVRSQIAAPCFPMPEAEHFEMLNNKWAFTRHCQALGVTCPESWFFADAAALFRRLERGELAPPLVAKPLDLDGGHGVKILTASNWQKAVGEIDYAPIIAQRLIEGEDIGASAFCRDGRMENFIVHRYGRGVYQAFADPAIRDAIDRVLQPLATSGVFNFDMRRDGDGKVYLLECNPRFFFKVSLAMEAGFNFVAFGINRAQDVPATPRRTTTVRLPAAAILRALGRARIDRSDLRVMRRLWADPLPYIRESLRIDWDE